MEMYAYEGPENTVEDQIVAIEQSVRKRASIRAITIGIIGCLLLGIGMSLTMIGESTTGFFVLGIIIGIVGLVIACSNYPLYNKHLATLREIEKPLIMELASRL